MDAAVYYSTYGHWSCALQNAGFDIKWHWQPEINKFVVPIHKNNFPSVPFAHIDGKLNILCGSPPCIGISNANAGGNANHPANGCFVDFGRFVERNRPDYFILEMVTQIFTTGKDTYSEFINVVDKTYAIQPCVFEASEYGSPAKRKRAYFIGSRYDMKPIGQRIMDNMKKSVYMPITDCIGKFEDSGFNEKGQLYNPYNANGELKSGPYGHLKAKSKCLSKDKPGYTITSRSTQELWHYNGKRLLATPEIKALMGFQNSYWFPPDRSIGEYAHMIASGVDIRFVTKLLKQCKKEIEGEN